MLGKNALVVDDSLTARTVLKHRLNQFDVIVESAADGSLALELLRDHTPDVIFLDHIMPGLDGFQVLQLLKTNQSTKGIPVVMYTSQAAPQYTSEAKSLGAIGVIPKEVTDEQLMRVLDKAELYQLRMVNDEHHAETEAADPAPRARPTLHAVTSAEAPVKPSAEPRAAQSNPSGGQANDVSDKGAGQESEQTGVSPQFIESQPMPRRGWVATLLLALVILAQGYSVLQDRQQQKIITDLSNRVLQQEQLLLDRQAQLESEQRKLTEATWRQVQFVVDVLVDQLQEEG